MKQKMKKMRSVITSVPEKIVLGRPAYFRSVQLNNKSIKLTAVFRRTIFIINSYPLFMISGFVMFYYHGRNTYLTEFYNIGDTPKMVDVADLLAELDTYQGTEKVDDDTNERRRMHYVAHFQVLFVLSAELHVNLTHP